jgi:hypothetical protein
MEKLRGCRKPFDELNRRLSGGEPGTELVAWLNGLPEVQRVVSAEFGGGAVREQNLSEWKQGGYEEWLRQQEALELVRNLSAETDDLKAMAGEPLSEKLGLWLAARYAVATRKLAVENGDLDWSRLRELCSDVVALRRRRYTARKIEDRAGPAGARARETPEGKSLVFRLRTQRRRNEHATFKRRWWRGNG